MKLIRWGRGWHYFGFMLYTNPDRNPVLAFSKAWRRYGVVIGRWQYCRVPRHD